MSKIQLEVNNVVYDGFTEISVLSSMELANGSFSFEATNEKHVAFPIATGAEARVLVGTEAVLTGYVDYVSPSYGARYHSIIIQGRDKTADIVDSTVGNSISLNDGVSLETIINLAQQTLGLELPIVNDAGEIDVFKKNELASSKTGENCFEFIEQFCRKRQVLFTTDGQGSIRLIKGGNQETLPIALVNEFAGGNNNILEASASFDASERFNRYILKSQGNPISGLIDTTLESKKGEATDTDIRATRVMEFQSETKSEIQTLQDRAKWEANNRRAKSNTYECVVQGFFYDKAQTQIWKPNKLVRVKDDYCGIDAILLIKDVNYLLSSTEGSRTRLTMVNKDSFTLQASQDAIDAQINKIGILGL